jgi:hypothetical protein
VQHTSRVDEIELPFRGWFKGTVPVMHAPEGDPTVLELACPLGNLKVFGLIDTPDHQEGGEELGLGMFSRKRIRCVVPRKYTHVQIVPSIRSPGFARWQLGYRSASSLPELHGSVTGGHTAVFRYTGRRTTAHLAVAKSYAYLKHYKFVGDNYTDLTFANAPFRGKVEIPGPGLIVVDSVVSSWTLTLPA